MPCVVCRAAHVVCCHCAGKMGVLRRLLRLWSAAGAKVLLFSQSVRMLAILEQVHSAAESAPMQRCGAQRCDARRWCCR